MSKTQSSLVDVQVLLKPVVRSNTSDTTCDICEKCSSDSGEEGTCENLSTTLTIHWQVHF